MTSSNITINLTDNTGYAAALAKIKLPKHFLHAPFYGQWQAAAGKTVIYYLILDGKNTLGCGLAVSLKIPGGYYYLYSPYGPLVPNWTPEVSESLKKFFMNFNDKKLLFTRLDAENLPPEFKPATPSVASTSALQPRTEWLLDITRPEEELLAGMHQKCRYHIKLSTKAGASFRVEPSSAGQLTKFYELMEATAERDNFHALPEADYAAAFEAAGENAFVSFADIEDQPVAAAFCVNFDSVTHYVYGCSSNEYRKIGIGYFLHWQTILHARSLGQKTYNFGGISGGVKGAQLAGVTQFKQKFGGYAEAHQLPSDIVKTQLGYSLFGLYKRLR